MSIKETITRVLTQRQGRLPKLEKVTRGLSELHSQLGNLQQRATQVAYRDDIPSDFSGTISGISAKVNDLADEVTQLNNSVSNLARRFSKGTINIGVAGKTGQGKSTLLQKISGLTDKEIPTNNSFACTGTKSKIYHSEGVPYAKIDFYSEDEFLREIIYPYFEKLNLPAPISLERFRDPLPPFSGSSSNRQVLDEAIYEKLKFIHSAFPSFKELLSKGSVTLERLEEIQIYILQHDPRTNEKRTNYLAVKVANIYTKFPKRDVTGLCLVDLPGLEAAEGFEKKLVVSLEHEVDAMIFVKLPAPQRVDFDEVDYKVIDLINNSVREVNIANWLFIVLNKLEDGSNAASCQLMKDKLLKESPALRTSNILVANNNNHVQVEQEVFSVVLRHLEQNLENTDRQFINALSLKMESIWQRLDNILTPAQKFFASEVGGADKQFIKLLKSFMTNLRIKLEGLLVEMNGAASSFGEEFKQEVETVCNDIKQHPPIPDPVTLTEQFAEYGGWHGAVEEQLNSLRAHLSSELARRLDAYLKNKVDTTLKEVLSRIFPQSLQNLLPPGVDQNPKNQVLLVKQMIDREKLPRIHEGFEYVTNFDYSYPSHFHHRVRGEMDRLSTYTRATVDEIIPKDADQKNVSEKAAEIARGLSNIYQETIFRVKDKLTKEMNEDPSHAIYTLVEEVKDRLVRAKNIDDEWFDFLAPLRAKVWADIFKEQEKILTLRKQWRDSIDRILNSAKQVKADFFI